jgi:Zn-finger nucleic acid-binding protein
MDPIVGPRYRCTGRDNYDLCGRCEGLYLQPHAMIKIYHSSQALPLSESDVKEMWSSHDDEREQEQHQQQQPSAAQYQGQSPSQVCVVFN